MGLLFLPFRVILTHNLVAMKNIPRVDLTDFLSKDSTRKKTFVKTLGEAFENIGFVILKGHFLTAAQTDLLYKEIKCFFDLTEAQKQAYEVAFRRFGPKIKDKLLSLEPPTIETHLSLHLYRPHHPDHRLSPA